MIISELTTKCYMIGIRWKAYGDVNDIDVEKVFIKWDHFVPIIGTAQARIVPVPLTRSLIEYFLGYSSV